VHQDGIEYVFSAEEVKQGVTLHYHLSQRSFIENNQNNTVHCPQPPAPEVQEPMADIYLLTSYVDYLKNPLVLGCIAAAAYAFFYLKSKFNLYSLGKACFEKAAWSLWKNKPNNRDLSQQDLDTMLLLGIQQTYNTTNITTAVARFLLAVEEEEDALNAYIEAAVYEQTRFFRVIFDDLTDNIALARERLKKLLKLKHIVQGWLLNDDGLHQRVYKRQKADKSNKKAKRDHTHFAPK
jgi:hypothetical protein